MLAEIDLNLFADAEVFSFDNGRFECGDEITPARLPRRGPRQSPL